MAEEPRKIEIAERPPDPDPRAYEHLVPVVELPARHANRPKHGMLLRGPLFFLDRDGWRCDLRKPIDFDLLRGHFQFPPSIELSEEAGQAFCHKTWVTVAGPMKR